MDIFNDKRYNHKDRPPDTLTTKKQRYIKQKSEEIWEIKNTES